MNLAGISDFSPDASFVSIKKSIAFEYFIRLLLWRIASQISETDKDKPIGKARRLARRLFHQSAIFFVFHRTSFVRDACLRWQWPFTEKMVLLRQQN